MSRLTDGDRRGVMSIVIRMQVQADPFLQQRAARSRSRFDFAQDDSQPSSAVAHGNGVGGAGLSFADWAHPPGGGLSIRFRMGCSSPISVSAYVEDMAVQAKPVLFNSSNHVASVLHRPQKDQLHHGSC